MLPTYGRVGTDSARSVHDITSFLSEECGHCRKVVHLEGNNSHILAKLGKFNVAHCSAELTLKIVMLLLHLWAAAAEPLTQGAAQPALFAHRPMIYLHPHLISLWFGVALLCCQALVNVSVRCPPKSTLCRNKLGRASQKHDDLLMGFYGGMGPTDLCMWWDSVSLIETINQGAQGSRAESVSTWAESPHRHAQWQSQG